jgi:hypothetical protein
MADIPTQPTVFGYDPLRPTQHLSMDRLRIRGESYGDKVTPNGTISVPKVITYGFGKRRWRVLVLDVIELPLQGSKDPDPPIPPNDRAFLYDEVMAQRERARIAERRVKELEKR